MTVPVQRWRESISRLLRRLFWAPSAPPSEAPEDPPECVVPGCLLSGRYATIVYQTSEAVTTRLDTNAAACPAHEEQLRAGLLSEAVRFYVIHTGDETIESGSPRWVEWREDRGSNV